MRILAATHRMRQAVPLLGLMLCCHAAAFADTPLTPLLSLHSAPKTGLYRAARADSTSFVRQFAKDDPRTQIIVSGPQAASVAKTLYDDITTHRDFKTKKGVDKVVILTLEQAEKAANEPKFSENTRIFLVCTKEMNAALPSTLEKACPVDLAQLPGGDGEVMSRCLNPRAGHLAFSMAVVAPDAARLRTLMGLFGESHGDYKALTTTLNAKYETYRLALFSAEADRDAVEKWGRIASKNVWADYKWYPLAAYETLMPEEQEERHLVFFLNRGDKTQPQPEPARLLLDNSVLKPTTSIIAKGKGPNGLVCAVFSSPTDLILHKRAAQYSHFDKIPASPAFDDVTDLRFIDRTVLLVHGVGIRLAQEDAENIRFKTAQVMREQLKLAIEERGAQFEVLQKEIVFQDLQGATNTAQKLRQKDGVRFVWLFQLTDYSGKTSFAPSQKSLTPEPPSYAQAHSEDAEPVEPTLAPFSGGGTKAKYNQEHAAWKPQHDAWENRKLSYDRYCEAQFPCSWECRIEKVCKAEVRGTLRLIDLDHPNTPVWEKPCSGSSSESSEYTTRTVQVHGTKNRPESLPCPANEDACPSKLLQLAGLNAGSEGIGILQATAWLPDGKPLPKQDSGGDDVKPITPQEPVHLSGSKVAAVDENSVTLKIDPDEGIQKGFLVDVATAVKEIPDPDNPGKILSRKVTEKVTLRIVSVTENVAEAVPATPNDKANLDHIKPGMSVVNPHSAPIVVNPPVKPQPGGGKKPGAGKKVTATPPLPPQKVVKNTPAPTHPTPQPKPPTPAPAAPKTADPPQKAASDPPANPPKGTFKVHYADEDSLLLDMMAADDLKEGDLLEIVLPAAKKGATPVRVRVQVKELNPVGKVATCLPVTPQDKAHLAGIKAGQSARLLPPTATPPH